MNSDGSFPALTNYPSDHFASLTTIKNSLTKLLVGKIFVGNYAERHYVDSLATYRDLVVVGPDEAELRKTLLKAIKIVRNALENRMWFGVTGNEHDRTPKGYCLWVNLSQIPLGKHWFKIESVDLQSKEILLKLEYLRSFEIKNELTVEHPESTELFDNFDPMMFLQGIEWPKVLNYGLHLVLNAPARFILNLRNVLTYKNICETITFSSVLILVVLTFLMEVAKYVCDYSIRLINEFSSLICSLTPIILGLIEFFTKCVGGFYLLILMLWRGGSTGPPIPANALGAAFDTKKQNQYHIEPQYGYPYARRMPQPRGRFSNAG